MAGNALLDQADNDGSTPLLHALDRGNLHLCTLLLQLGARPVARDGRSRTMLHVIAEKCPDSAGTAGASGPVRGRDGAAEQPPADPQVPDAAGAAAGGKKKGGAKAAGARDGGVGTASTGAAAEDAAAAVLLRFLDALLQLPGGCWGFAPTSNPHYVWAQGVCTSSFTGCGPKNCQGLDQVWYLLTVARVFGCPATEWARP